MHGFPHVSLSPHVFMAQEHTLSVVDVVDDDVVEVVVVVGDFNSQRFVDELQVSKAEHLHASAPVHV